MDGVDIAALTVEALGREEPLSRAFEVTAATDRGIVEENQIFSGLKADLSTQITR
jgi:hypothetical protein